MLLRNVQPIIQYFFHRSCPEYSSSAQQLSLERLSQFVQVALHTNSVYGNKRKYFSVLSCLEENKTIGSSG